MNNSSGSSRDADSWGTRDFAGGFSGLQTELKTTAEGKKVLQVIQGLPNFLATVLHTASTNPSEVRLPFPLPENFSK